MMVVRAVPEDYSGAENLSSSGGLTSELSGGGSAGGESLTHIAVSF